MESRIIYHVEKFIYFLFGEKNGYDPEQKIYNKLLSLEGEELETWTNEKFKKYIICAGNYFEFEENTNKSIFELWYYIAVSHFANSSQNQLMKIDEIFNDCDSEYIYELQTIKLKLRIFQGQNQKNYEEDNHWKLHIMSDYMEMYIMSMSSSELKSYIIQLIEPVEIK
jgi:hypothetical protein